MLTHRMGARRIGPRNDRMHRVIRFPSFVAVALFGLSVSTVQGQSLYSRFLDRFDTKHDGKISRANLPEGTLRDTFDRMAKQYNLDPAKTYSRDELEKVLGLTSSSSSP